MISARDPATTSLSLSPDEINEQRQRRRRYLVALHEWQAARFSSTHGVGMQSTTLTHCGQCDRPRFDISWPIDGEVA